MNLFSMILSVKDGSQQFNKKIFM